MSREQPLCREDSEELSKALAAGEWWAIVEVEIPISELPEFGDFTWCGPLEVEEAEAPVPTRTPLGSPVPKSQDWRNRHLSETVKPERQHPQEGPAAVESPQHAPVPTWFSPGSTDWRSQHPQQSKWMQKRVQKAPAAESSQQAPVPTGSPPKPPLPLAPRIPKGALVNSGTSQGSLVPSVSPKLGESLRIPKQPWQKQREQNIPKGASGNVGVCQPAPKNKICVDIVKKDRKPRKTDRIKTSHQHQISIPPRSQMNRKRALDNADVDRSLTSTQNAPLGNQSQGPGLGTSQRQEIVQFMHHIHTFF
ncbi:pleckstrin homology domain-containing family O member 2-like [Pimephales promelas]|uniref:pleckstrin homology domain-containing family O member 2-like n=1 Tax=Pimephales promelas TaxID=90988 RepID=UPI001955A705|nr:pleckstrin homology domain-containing family O member 2-like [Pimephales promelas]